MMEFIYNRFCEFIKFIKNGYEYKEDRKKFITFLNEAENKINSRLGEDTYKEGCIEFIKKISIDVMLLNYKHLKLEENKDFIEFKESKKKHDKNGGLKRGQAEKLLKIIKKLRNI